MSRERDSDRGKEGAHESTQRDRGSGLTPILTFREASMLGVSDRVSEHGYSCRVYFIIQIKNIQDQLENGYLTIFQHCAYPEFLDLRVNSRKIINKCEHVRGGELKEIVLRFSEMPRTRCSLHMLFSSSLSFAA